MVLYMLYDIGVDEEASDSDEMEESNSSVCSEN